MQGLRFRLIVVCAGALFGFGATSVDAAGRQADTRPPQSAATEDAPVPGGLTRFAGFLHIAPVPDRARFLSEAIRIVYASPSQNAVAADAFVRRLDAYLVEARRARTPAASTDVAPVPLTAAIWSSAVFGRTVAADDLIGAIVRDRRASLLCYGLAALDDETLQVLAANPALLTRLYRRAAPTVAAFGESLRVRAGRVLTPGGDDAVPVWEGVIGEKVDRPERFIDLVLEQRKGRVAYVYDTLAHADRRVAALALGGGNAAEASQRLIELLDAAARAFPEWDTTASAFVRPAAELSMLLARMPVGADGAAPANLSRAFWQRTLDGASSDVAARATDDQPADPAWLAGAILTRPVVQREHRLDQLAFGGRVFASAAPEELADAAAAIRAFPGFPLLMLTLERLGIRSPRLYAAAAARAERLNALDPNAGYAALAQFQGALAIVTRLARVRSIDRDGAETLVRGLLEATVDEAGRYNGEVLGWFDQRVRPLLAADASIDAALLAAAAGSPDPAARRVEWEGQPYRVDVRAAELRRLQRIRERQGGASIEAALRVAAAARLLSQPALTDETLSDAVTALRDVGPALSPPDVPPEAITPLSVVVAPPHRTIEESLAELTAIEQRGSFREAARVAGRLAAAADLMLGEAFVSMAYAFEIADPDGTMLIASDVSRRHDFGYGLPFRDPKLTSAWTIARAEVRGTPWHLAGSVLGLDVALAPAALRRIDADRVPDAPTMNFSQTNGFAAAVGLVDVAGTTDADRDALVDAIAHGRRRLAAALAGSEPLERFVDDVSLDGWRRRALQWTIDHDPAHAPALFSLSELMVAGGGAPQAFAAWGANAWATAACLCLRMPAPGEWRRFVGQPEFGLPGLVLADAPLRVALALHDLALPAALQKFVLSAAMQDFIDAAHPSDPQDWLTLARTAQSLTDSRIVDYVAAAAADGPLVPDTEAR